MLNASLAILVLIVALVAVLVVAGLVIALLVARSRRRDESFDRQFLRPEPPAPGAGGWAAQQGRPSQNDTVPLLPFDRATEQDYERLAAEPFQAPPATPLGQRAAPEPFSWTAAVNGGDDADGPGSAEADPETVPASEPSEQEAFDPFSWDATERRAAPEAAPEPELASEPESAPAQESSQPAASGDELDRTALVGRDPAARWVLVLPDGAKHPLAADTVLGRRPEPVPGVHAIALEDPTRTVSKMHARLRFDGGAWTIEDLGSTNGVVLLQDGGGEQVIPPHTPVPAEPRMLLGTLLVRLQDGGGAR